MNMKAQQTPGPWIVGDELDPAFGFGRDILAEPFGEGTGWVEIARNIENPHDAYLMKAAPQMLEALLEISATIKDAEGDIGWQDLDRFEHIADLAIHAATEGK